MLMLPQLPHEVLCLIFAQADPSTLAALGRVNFDCLSSTAPLLYRDVTIRSVKALEGLFCDRGNEESARASRVKPLLSLEPIRSLILNIDEHPIYTLQLSLDRLPSRAPLLLDLVHIHCLATSNDIYNHLHTYLLPLLNPTRLAYEEMEEGETPMYAGLSNADVLSGWTRLETLDFKGVIPTLELTRHNDHDEVLYLAAQPFPSLGRRRTVRLHVEAFCRRPAYSESVHSWVEWLADQNDITPWELHQAGSVVLVVRSEAMRKKVEAGLKSARPDVQRVMTVSLEA